MPIKDYSTTPASNTSLFPEGMNPADVNNGMRQVQADIRSFYNTPQWRDLGNVPTRTSATTFTLSGDQTALYPVNMRLRLTDTAAFLYGTITAVSYSSPNTTVTVTLDSGALTTNLTIVEAGLDPSNSPIPLAAVLGGANPTFTAITLQGAAPTETISRFASDATAPNIVFTKSRSPTIGSESAVTGGDVLARISAAGSDGTSRVAKASIQAIVNGSVSTGNVPTDLVFYTGTTTETERFRINSAGVVAQTNGTLYGSNLGASSTDLSKHISLYSTDYGFGITAGALNYNVPTGASHALIIGGSNKLVTSSTGTLATDAVTAPNFISTGAAGSIGDYVFASSSGAASFNSTIAGSSLTTSNHANTGGGTVLSGTYRCMGYQPSGSYATLWKRIA